MHLALKIPYYGTKFHGFATQSKLRIIEEELNRCLQKISKKMAPQKIKNQTVLRTDQGVSAKGTIAVFDT